jgi:hypothetical protein
MSRIVSGAIRSSWRIAGYETGPIELAPEAWLWPGLWMLIGRQHPTPQKATTNANS